MNNQAAQTMPELPAPVFFAAPSEGYTAAQMHKHARDYAAALSQPAGVAEPDTALLVSMATCLNHGFGLLDPSRQQSMLRDMRKLWDEVLGRGYYRPERADFYMGMINPVRADALAAAPAASGGEGRPVPPPQCRNRLMHEGKPYPKSGCAVCKTGGMTGCPYEKAVHAPQPPSGAPQSSNPNPVTPGLSSESGASVSERALEAVAWAAYGTSDELGPVMLPDYVGTMDVIRKRVMEDARHEGFNGHFVERMANLGWWVEPLFHAPAIERALSSPRQEGECNGDSVVVNRAVDWLRLQTRRCNVEASASIRQAGGQMTCHAEALTREAEIAWRYADELESLLTSPTTGADGADHG